MKKKNNKIKMKIKLMEIYTMDLLNFKPHLKLNNLSKNQNCHQN